MFSNAERKYARLNSGLPDELTYVSYNMILGACVVYGLIVNALIVTFLGGYFANVNYLVILIGYLVCAFAGVFITRSQNPVASFVGYNLVVLPIGILLSVLLPSYLASDIQLAIDLTGIITVVMLIAASAFPWLFEKLGRVLFVSLIVTLVASFGAFLLGFRGIVWTYVGIVIFTLYIGYDWYKAQMYPKTLDNAIDCALDIYLDIINLFLRLLSVISGNRSKSN